MIWYYTVNANSMQKNYIKKHIQFSSGFQKIDEKDFEIVERKGIGHPDTLADGVAEAISIAYSEYCLKKFGVILHHNLDKTSLVGGLVDIDFAKGKVLKPAKLILNGRMSDSFGSKKIGYKKMQVQVAEKYLKSVLPNLDVKRGLEIISYTNSYSHNPYWYHPRGKKDVPDSLNPHSNDSSASVSYWPLSLVEKAVLEMEKLFYKNDSSPKFDFVGQDIKFMAVRKKHNVDITACIPFISTKTPNPTFYKGKLKKIRNELMNIAKSCFPKHYEVNVNINTADNSGDVYLLLTGSCIEAGEEGVVGRGNKSRGVISSVRPHSMEASHGKNPVYHVGKIFTVVADSLSKNISEQSNCECNVYITTKIRDALYMPNNVVVETSKPINQKKALEMIHNHLTYLNWTNDILTKRLLLPAPGKGNFYSI